MRIKLLHFAPAVVVLVVIESCVPGLCIMFHVFKILTPVFETLLLDIIGCVSSFTDVVSNIRCCMGGMGVFKSFFVVYVF